MKTKSLIRKEHKSDDQKRYFMEVYRRRQVSVCYLSVCSNFSLCQFCRCAVHKKCSGIRDKLKGYSKFKFQECANQQTEDQSAEDCYSRKIAEDCPCIQLNGHSLEIFETFYHLGDTIGARGGAVGSVITRIRSAWSMFKDLVSLLSSRGLPLYSVCT